MQATCPTGRQYERNRPSSPADYPLLGLRVGLEIHRQLNTKYKLFCKCRTTLATKPPSLKFERRLRPTQSELGQIDPAALFEFHKGRSILYETDDETSCLVELDEEPPHPLNLDAINIAVTISLLLRAPVLDEIHTMRKIVIDGSNTTGFQRTAVVGLNGTLDVDGKKIPIQQVTLEEDAARKLNETKTSTIFRLDRLGVPLIEIATGPVINSPMEAGKVALAIGQLLRSTKQVKRGLGTIRQDLNVSIKDGSLIEIKGVQELELVSEAVEYEVQRQLKLLEIRDELKTRNVTRSSLQHNEIVDVTELFSGSPSKVVQASLKHGGTVLALKLQGFKGLLGRELVPGIRLGTEMAKRAIFYGRVGGIFHSDELPGYGITATEIEKLVSYLSCNEKDGFAIIADDRQNAMEGLNAVLERACEAIEGVPEETRVANPDGTTHYLRPRPGAARMYPETDVPPVQINLEKLENIKFNLPKSTTELAKEIEAKYSISTKLALQIAESDYLPTFEAILAHSKNLGASFTATILTESTRSLAREGVPIENVTDTDLREIFEMVADGETAKESVIDLLRWLATHPGSHPQDALDKLNLHMLQRSDLEQIISKVLMAHKDHAQSNVNKEYGKIMNMVMAQVRGRADPKIVNEILHDKMDRMTR